VPRLEFEIAGSARTASIDTLVVAGWTGRDRAAVDRHIAELAAIGVGRPDVVPCFYRLTANLLTHADTIDVLGSDSSGEAEVVLVSLPDGLYVTVGSDHTDRRVERSSVALAKQLCPKPIGRQLWPFDEVRSHWDDVVLRSWIREGGARVLYQQGTLAEMLAPQDLIARYTAHAGTFATGTVMYCGTLVVNGAVRAADSFEVELEDPKLNRTLRHAYRPRSLAIVSERRGGQMVIEKEHKEFHTIDLDSGWEVPRGYPAGIEQQILAGSLDEQNKKGFRTRHLRFKPGVYTTAPFVHDYWEEVYVVSGDLIVGNDANGDGGEKFGPSTYACRPPGTYHGPFKSEGGCLLLELHYYDERAVRPALAGALPQAASVDVAPLT